MPYVCVCGHHKDKHDYLGCTTCGCGKYFAAYKA